MSQLLCIYAKFGVKQYEKETFYLVVSRQNHTPSIFLLVTF